MPKGIKGFIKGHKHSEETKRKIGLANRGIWIKYKCDNCGKECSEKQSHYKRSKTHFCNMKCFKEFQTKLPPQKQNAYRGIRKEGANKQVYHRNYCKRHPETISHLKARRYARERGALGSHTLTEWKELKATFGYKCANCHQQKQLTKDHIVPLSQGGNDFISNIQPLCRNCNSKKWKKTENPELLSM
jgi:5-methylcytosine-specific restriction endonuclease McrA